MSAESKSWRGEIRRGGRRSMSSTPRRWLWR